jgi:3-dehydroquinate dehydratase
MAGSARLRYKSKVLGYHLDEIEAMMEAEARKRELRITKLYSRFNNDIARRIQAAEGNLEVI